MITIYTRTSCAPCATLKRYFAQKNVAFEEKSADEALNADKVIELTGRLLLPTTVINGEVVSGLNIPRISELLRNTV